MMLKIENLCKQYGRGETLHPVLSQVNLSVEEGDFLVILGQSGCGKTTFLRILGGFLSPDAGTVFLDGKPVKKPSCDMIMVFQSFDQLFPWFTLEKNILYALKKSRGIKDSKEGREQACRYMEMTGLLEFKDQFPHTLSGGMKQRGALARALALKPRLLLMDEPFSSLDYLTRKQARKSLKNLTQTNRSTVVLVTHDIEEAVELGTKIAILDHKTHRISHWYDSPKDHVHLREELEEALR